ncbi:hypothetical protein [Pradoshia sp.]
MDKLGNLKISENRARSYKRLSDATPGGIVPYLWREPDTDQENLSMGIQMNHSKQFDRIDVICKNDSPGDISFKVFFVTERTSLVSACFYSPADALVYFYGDEDIVLLNGHDRANISIMEQRSRQAVFEAMQRGTVLPSPLARGYVICATMYQRNLRPGESSMLSNWTVRGKTKEEAMHLNQLVKNQTSIYQ